MLLAGAQGGVILPVEGGQERAKLAGIAAARDAFKRGAAARRIGIGQLKLHQGRADDPPHAAIGAQLAEPIRGRSGLFARIYVAQRECIIRLGPKVEQARGIVLPDVPLGPLLQKGWHLRQARGHQIVQ